MIRAMSRAHRDPIKRSGPPEPAYQLPPDVTEARERILRTAYELFRNHGVGGIGVDRIAAEAHVAKTSLYRHFRSKDELVLAVLERHQEIWLGWLEAEIERHGGTPRERILTIFDAFDEWFQQSGYRGCLFINTLLETHDRLGVIRSAANVKLAEVRALLKRLGNEAGLRDPDEFASAIQMLMMGAIVAAVEGRSESATRAGAIALALLEQELSATPSRTPN
jgi:AcrR family transcriptional regulator